MAWHKMKALGDALEPDERYAIMTAGHAGDPFRRIAFSDHHAMVAGLELPAAVPETVLRLYRRALHALLYAWFDYELMLIAEGQALATLEFALKMQLVGGGHPDARGLGGRLRAAAKAGLIPAPPPQAPGGWPSDHDLLAAIRNEIAHGSDHVHPPALAQTVFERCRSLICELYSVKAP